MFKCYIIIFIMKFEDYILNLKNNNLHKEKEKIYDKISSNINNINNNFIFYGHKNIGKYSQALYFISRYSKNNLKYKKKIQIDSGKFIYNINLSDVHYEIDFDVLSHTSKTLWFEIYDSIIKSIEINKEKKFLICKNFHKIPSEILEVFYYYLNDNPKLIFILLTTDICFLPKNIVDTCNIISFTTNKRLNEEVINKLNNRNSVINKTLLEIIKTKNLNNTKLRETIYDIFIKQYSVYECVWFLVNELKITGETLDNIHKCCSLYNNNYRPIYHIERLILLFRKEYHT